jgi:WXG100 family type VII secretion target
MSDIKVGYEALDGAAAEIKNKAVAIEDKLNAMEKRMEGRAEHWTGAASSAFTTSRLEWDKAMTDMKEILNEIGLTVGLSNAEYAAAEARNAKRFNA